MLRATDYEIINGHSLEDLESEVYDMLDKGWIPSGGVTRCNDEGEGTVFYIQAMVKLKEHVCQA